MIYKVGDKVTIRKDLEDHSYYGKVYFVPEMLDSRGKSFEIMKVRKELGIMIYNIVGMGDWSYSQEMFLRSWKDKYGS